MKEDIAFLKEEIKQLRGHKNERGTETNTNSKSIPDVEKE
jgi:hypothetical protein